MRHLLLILLLSQLEKLIKGDILDKLLNLIMELDALLSIMAMVLVVYEKLIWVPSTRGSP